MNTLQKIWFSSAIWFPVLGVFTESIDPGSLLAQIWGILYIASIAYYLGKSKKTKK